MMQVKIDAEVQAENAKDDGWSKASSGVQVTIFKIMAAGSIEHLVGCWLSCRGWVRAQRRRVMLILFERKKFF